MSDKNVKVLRGQVRQAVKELLPELLKQEMQTAIYKQLAGELTAKLEVIHSQILTNLEVIDNRAKDVQSFMMREIMTNMKAGNVAPVEVADVAPVVND